MFTFLFRLLLASLLLSGCAPKEASLQRFFWPIGGDDPKIEFIRTVGTDRDVQKGGESWLAEALLGIEEPGSLFVSPYDVASDGKGRVYVSDIALNDVLILDFAAHKVRHFERPAQDELFFVSPMGLAIAPAGGVYVSDNVQGRIYLFDAAGKVRKIFGQNILRRPTGLVYDSVSDRLYVADAGLHQVVVFTPDGLWQKTFGTRGEAPGEFNYPLDLDVDGDGNLYVLDSMNARIQVFDAKGAFLRSFGERGTSLGSFYMAKGIAVDRSGHVYVSDAIGHRFVIFDLMGTHLMTLGGRTSSQGNLGLPGGFDMPKGVAADSNDAIWVVDSLNRMVHQYQFLNRDYLEKNPVQPGQAYIPEALR
ncbi:6-bladed beta-propeller [Trichloromonas sp.]|uniref:6-bladed beta-propeller n=1 Tax=Trichloromonas sp. TaxID=3069249 RepID=UPI003D814344